MRDIVAKAKGKVEFIDAPLARGEPAAESGELLIFGGGEREYVRGAAGRHSQAFADAIHYLGALGAGQVGKMVNNLILWACIVGQ